MTCEAEIVELLKTSGVPWEIKNGSRHRKIVVGGKLVGILPHGKVREHISYRSQKNIVAQVRRAIAQEQS